MELLIIDATNLDCYGRCVYDTSLTYINVLTQNLAKHIYQSAVNVILGAFVLYSTCSRVCLQWLTWIALSNVKLKMHN